MRIALLGAASVRGAMRDAVRCTVLSRVAFIGVALIHIVNMYCIHVCRIELCDRVRHSMRVAFVCLDLVPVYD